MLPNEGQSAFMELGAAIANRNDVSDVRDWRIPHTRAKVHGARHKSNNTVERLPR
jgi:hypothetical protein